MCDVALCRPVPKYEGKSDTVLSDLQEYLVTMTAATKSVVLDVRGWPLAPKQMLYPLREDTGIQQQLEGEHMHGALPERGQGQAEPMQGGTCTERPDDSSEEELDFC